MTMSSLAEQKRAAQQALKEIEDQIKAESERLAKRFTVQLRHDRCVIAVCQGGDSPRLAWANNYHNIIFTAEDLNAMQVLLDAAREETNMTRDAFREVAAFAVKRTLDSGWADMSRPSRYDDDAPF